MNIQWYPGHMTKTKRMIAEQLKLVDIVAEVIDARIPVSSRNPDINELTEGKPRLMILNRADQADPEGNKLWKNYFKTQGFWVMECDAKSGSGVNRFSSVMNQALGPLLEKRKEKGQAGRPIRAMIVGVPNVGKSTLINKLAKRKSAKTQDRPGVTRGKQWVMVSKDLELLDTPGILWPKFEDETTGLYLAFTGAVKDAILDTETLGAKLMELLNRRKPDVLQERYHMETSEEMTGWELLEAAGKRRGFLISGGEVDLERMANILLDEFRGGKLGRITLELPDQ